jgi:sulfatase modifying factor 1
VALPDDTSPTTTPFEIELPTDISLIDIPGNLFEMGGATNSNDTPVVSVTVSDLAISDTELTNSQYIEFLNATYNDGWISVELQSTNDTCGNYEEYMIVATDAAPHSGKIYLPLGETGGCSSDGHPEHINNKSWITFINESFELVDGMNADWPANWTKCYGADAFAQYYEASLPTEAQWEYAAKMRQFTYASVTQIQAGKRHEACVGVVKR